MKRVLKKGLCVILTVMLILSGIGRFNVPKVSAATYTGKDVEVTLAADAVSNNLDLTGFSDKLKAQLTSEYGIPTDKIHIKTVDSSSASTSGFTWDRFDHTNVSGNALSNANNNVVYYNDTNYDPRDTDLRSYDACVRRGR